MLSQPQVSTASGPLFTPIKHIRVTYGRSEMNITYMCEQVQTIFFLSVDKYVTNQLNK